jgi:hypothetical protein
MRPIDRDTGRSRGYMMLIHRKDDDVAGSSKHRPPNLPMAILLRSEMKQSDIRRRFKDHVANIEGTPSFDDIATFFYDEGSYQSIWNMVLPQLRPYDSDIAAKAIVTELRSLIQMVLNSLKKSGEKDDEDVDDSSHCRANHCRTIELRTEEAILIVYLACLDLDARERIVFDPKFHSDMIEQAQIQLLAEAELVRYAIDTSDQVPTRNSSTPNSPRNTSANSF